MKGILCFQVKRESLIDLFRSNDNLILCTIRRKVCHVALDDHGFPTHATKTTIRFLFVRFVANDNDLLGQSKLITHPLRKIHATTEMKSVQACLNTIVDQE